MPLESVFLASKDLIADFSSAKKDGEIQIEKYFEERIKLSAKLITQTISRNKHKFEKPPTEVRDEYKASKKTDAMENNDLVALIQAAQKSASHETQDFRYFFALIWGWHKKLILERHPNKC